MRFEGEFFMPVADTSHISRADLFFGLRRATWFYHEIVVPGLGGVRFCRQLSWAVGALALKTKYPEKIPYPAIKVANGIEALGCKMSWIVASRMGEEKYPYRGSRAFSRDKEELSFKGLSQQSGYVQVPYRMSTVRALCEHKGLGLVNGDAIRFNRMELSPKGEELASAFLEGSKVGRGSASIGSFLEDWICGKKAAGENAHVTSLHRALGPDAPLDIERKLVLECLNTVGVLPQGIPEDPNRRIRLVEYFSGKQDEPILDWVQRVNSEYGAQVQAAIAFDELRVGIQRFYATCTKELEGVCGGILLNELGASEMVVPAFAELQQAAALFLKTAVAICEHPDAIAQAQSIVKCDIMAAINQLIDLENRILYVSDGKVYRGPLYRNMISASDDSSGEDEVNEPPPEIFLPHASLYQLQQVLQDCGVGMPHE